MEEIRVRFAPSPTGPLHIGGARSALFNYLFAKHHGGKLILRIEDTDLERSSRQSEENILAALKWLGMDWDEGPDVGGDYGPYRQTERIDTYRIYTEHLLDQGKAYYCYCSEEELEAERQAYSAKGELPRYSGKCRNLSSEEKTLFESEGRKPVIRFRVPDHQEVVIDDAVRGRVVFESEGIGDYVIVKSDGIPTYNYAVVIDDRLMKISHVIRAEEHLSNTPRQVLLYKALGWKVPQFAHISLILGEDRSKMSKRHGATSVVQYETMGYLPEAVVNFLALLGWSPPGEQEIMSLSDIIELFTLDRVAKNPAVFDMDKLRWLNGMYIRQMPLELLTERARPYLEQAGYWPPNPNEKEKGWARMAVAALQDRLEILSEIADKVKVLAGEDVTLENQEAQEILQAETFPRVLEAFRNGLKCLPELNAEAVKALLKGITKELKLGGKQVYMPIRIALTGQMHGPELFYLLPLLGVELAEKRIDSILEQAGLEALRLK